jgi:hypothetical protein
MVNFQPAPNLGMRISAKGLPFAGRTWGTDPWHLPGLRCLRWLAPLVVQVTDQGMLTLRCERIPDQKPAIKQQSTASETAHPGQYS